MSPRVRQANQPNDYGDEEDGELAELQGLAVAGGAHE
jgi:hypothetical protein